VLWARCQTSFLDTGIIASVELKRLDAKWTKKAERGCSETAEPKS
jgi:hypothetical protein